MTTTKTTPTLTTAELVTGLRAALRAKAAEVGTTKFSSQGAADNAMHALFMANGKLDELRSAFNGAGLAAYFTDESK